mgnify:CR=1 FL=1
MGIPPPVNELILVFLAALLTALATGLGAVPFAMVRDMSTRTIGVGHGLAAGAMIGASVGLVQEGSVHGVWPTWAGVALGLVAIAGGLHVLKRMQKHRQDAADEGLQVRTWSSGAILVGIMTLHSFSEGIGVGVSWGGGDTLGWFVTLAIAIHNIPEGLAISLVLVSQGSSVARAAWMSIVSSLPQPLVAVPAFMFVEQFRTVLPWGLGVAAGAMVWMSFSDLIPEAREALSRRAVFASVAFALVGMLAVQRLLAL